MLANRALLLVVASLCRREPTMAFTLGAAASTGGGFGGFGAASSGAAASTGGFGGFGAGASTGAAASAGASAEAAEL